MPVLLRSSLVLASLLALGASATAQKTEAEIRAVYARMNALIAKRDVPAYVALFERVTTPDFVSEMDGQKIDRARFVADVKTGMAGKDAPTAQARVASAKRSGTALLLNVQWTVRGKGPNGKPYAVKMSSVDTWISTPKGYRLKKTAASISPAK